MMWRATAILVLLFIVSCDCTSCSKSACCPSWRILDNTAVAFGKTQPPTVNTIPLCQTMCTSTPGCSGFDWNGATTTCWLSGSWSGTRYSGTAPGITHYKLVPASSGCGACSPRSWAILANTAVGWGKTQPSTVNTIPLCQAMCISTEGCDGFDWNGDTTTCWLSGSWSGTRYSGTAYGITRYELLPESSNCIAPSIPTDPADYPKYTNISTTCGAVNGNTVALNDGTLINSWYGIPFASPPVGPLRFQPPQPCNPWTGVLQATQLPAVCMQNLSDSLSLPSSANMSEDCLYLNIFSPQKSRDGLPVMVWLYESDYAKGGNIVYPGHFLAAKGVVVVVPNYRLGALGFLATPDGTVTGNMGLKDQTMALRWVHDNIAKFGGDPNHVTIFGVGAGAISVSLHVISPYSRGLYQQAIMESGAYGNDWSINHPDSNPKSFVYQTAKKLNCSPGSDSDIVSCLRTKSATDIVNAQGIVCEQTLYYYCQTYAPIVDGPGGFIPKLPAEMAAELSPSDTVPSMSGINRDGGSLVVITVIPETKFGGFNDTTFQLLLKRFIAYHNGSHMSADKIDMIVRTTRWNYVNWPYLDDLEANRQAFNKILTDGAFGYAWDNQLKVLAAKNPKTYGYVFAYQSPYSMQGGIPNWMGVPYMAEISYVWGYHKLSANPNVLADIGLSTAWNPLDTDYDNYIMTLWTNFAKYGNPTPQPVKSPFGSSLTTWPTFSLNDAGKVLYIDVNVTVATNYRQRDYALWTDLIPYISNQP